MSTKRLDEQGFSLLEVIVALAIMAVGFATVLQLFSGSIRSIGMSRDYLKGITLASHKINELELADFATEEFSGRFKDEEDYGWNLSIEPYETPLNDEEANIRVLKINVQVFWNQFGKERDVTLATLRTLGTTYPSADTTLLGLNKSGIYGNVIGGAGKVSLSGADTENPPPPPPAESPSANISGQATAPVEISGFQLNIPPVDISGLRSGGRP
ncbi:MAG: prepilin-type N-terminal cleavage/methylation domain-containing protein [Nitrospinales bacterium]